MVVGFVCDITALREKKLEAIRLTQAKKER